jgi:hypothetical protein
VYPEKRSSYDLGGDSFGGFGGGFGGFSDIMDAFFVEVDYLVVHDHEGAKVKTCSLESQLN